MKKIVSILLCFIFLIPSFSFANEEAIKIDSEDLAFAKAVGVLPEDMTDDKIITRYELANIFTSIIMDDYESSQSAVVPIFSDMTEDMFSVKFVYDIGIMNGVGDGKFAPDNYVTYNQLVKAFITFLGYKGEAESKGGYPTGYMAVALRRDLIEDISSGDDYVTARKVASLLKAAQNLEVKDYLSVGNKTALIDSGENYLELYKNITRIRGVVTSVHATDFYSDETKDFYDVKIDDRGYRLSGSAVKLAEHLGHQVDAYVKVEGDIDNEIVFFEMRNSNVIIIPRDDVKSATLSKITYYKDGSKSRRISINPMATTVIYNGKSYASYTEAMLNPFETSSLDGSITVIDNDNDGVADVVSVDAYQTIVVSKVTDEKIYSKYIPTGITTTAEKANVHLNIEDIEEPDIEFTNILGETISLSSIEPGDILSVSKDISGNLRKIVLTIDKYSGVIKALQYREDGSVETMQIDEEEYKCAVGLSLSPNVSSIQLGNRITAYFNKDGKIAEIENLSDAEYSKGYIYGIDYGKGISKKAKLGVFSATGKLLLLEMCDRVKYNDGERKTRDQIVTLIGTTPEGKPKRQPILYRLNSEGAIDKICLADEAQVNDTFYMYPGFDGVTERDGYRASAKNFGGKLLIDNSTAIFLIPKEADRDSFEDYKVVDSTYFPDDNKDILFKAYGTDKNSPVAEILAVEDTKTFTVGSKSPFAVVDKIVNVIDEDGNDIYKLKGVINGVIGETLIKPEDYTITLSAGDVIRYVTDVSGYARSIKLLYKADEIKEADRIKFGSNPSQSGFLAGIRYSYGKVVYCDDVCFTVELTEGDPKPKDSYSVGGFKYIECTDEGDGKLRPKPSSAERLFDSNQNPGNESKVLIYTSSGDGKYIVIFNE